MWKLKQSIMFYLKKQRRFGRMAARTGGLREPASPGGRRPRFASAVGRPGSTGAGRMAEVFCVLPQNRFSGFCFRFSSLTAPAVTEGEFRLSGCHSRTGRDTGCACSVSRVPAVAGRSSFPSGGTEFLGRPCQQSPPRVMNFWTFDVNLG